MNDENTNILTFVNVVMKIPDSKAYSFGKITWFTYSQQVEAKLSPIPYMKKTGPAKVSSLGPFLVSD